MSLPNFDFEKSLWKKGYRYVAGVDEVGRGCFAGIVSAGCVVFPKDILIPEDILVNDSKKVSPRQREKAAIWIKKNALTWGVGSASVSEINRYGMGKASFRAFRRAIRSLNMRIDYLLIDAFYIPYVKGLRRKNQKAIIDGDEKSLTIAAASIIAKVHRDNIMLRLSKNSKYKSYGWGRNKGYGTKEHQEAIKKYGITRLHRKEFVKKLIVL